MLDSFLTLSSHALLLQSFFSTFICECEISFCGGFFLFDSSMHTAKRVREFWWFEYRLDEVCYSHLWSKKNLVNFNHNSGRFWPIYTYPQKDLICNFDKKWKVFSNFLKEYFIVCLSFSSTTNMKHTYILRIQRAISFPNMVTIILYLLKDPLFSFLRLQALKNAPNPDKKSEKHVSKIGPQKNLKFKECNDNNNKQQ